MPVSSTDHMGSGYVSQNSYICNVSVDRVNGLPVSDNDKVADSVLERGLCQLNDASQRYHRDFSKPEAHDNEREQTFVLMVE